MPPSILTPAVSLPEFISLWHVYDCGGMCSSAVNALVPVVNTSVVVVVDNNCRRGQLLHKIVSKLV